MALDRLALQQRYRVAIVGGGPAGSACALALSQQCMTDILIIEAGDYSQFRIGESILPESLQLFQALAIDPAFLQKDHMPCYGTCSYWGSEKRGYNDTLMNPRGHGWRLDRSKFDRFLATQAQSSGVQLLTSTRLKDALPAVEGGFKLTLASSDSGYKMVHADFVVDASGANAVFARQQGSQKIKAQPLVCLAARFVINNAKDNYTQLTHLESVEHGWWYGAQLPNNHLLMAFFCDARTVKAQQLQQSGRWHALLGKAVNSARFIESTEPLSDDITICNAPSHCLDRLYGPRWLAVGDAASSYDPITSQGIVKSISNALAAADVVLGKADPVHYSQSINAMYQLYLTMRDRYYQQEQRWPDSPFWQKYQSTAY